MSNQWLFLLAIVYVSNSWAMQCYTCDEDQENLACSQFRMENPLFSKECETGTRSCRLARKVNENVILSRSCEPLKMDDCKIANSIEFCYCTRDLCNMIGPLDDDKDDDQFLEDLAEGSGTSDTTTYGKTLPSSTEKGAEVYKATEVSSNCSKSQSNLCLPAMIAFAFFSRF